MDSPSPVETSITVEAAAEGLAATFTTVYRVFATGEVGVDLDFVPGGSLPELPRFGMQTTLRPGYDRLVWHGKGPHETYDDRQDARVGIYESTVREQFTPYLMPQETGNHVAVRWIALLNPQGEGLLAIGDPLLSANALHYTTEDLFSPTQKSNYYPYQLPDRKTVTLNLDLRQRGLGGVDSWGFKPSPPFRIQPKPMAYSYRLKLVKKGDDLARAAR